MAPDKTHSDGDIVGQNTLGEELTRLAESRGVVGVECLVDQVDDRNIAVNRRRLNPLAMQKMTFVVHQANIFS